MLVNINSASEFSFIALVRNINAENECIKRYSEKSDWCVNLTSLDDNWESDLEYFKNHNHFQVTRVKNQRVYCSISVIREYKNSVRLEYVWTNEKYETIKTERHLLKKDLALKEGVYFQNELSPLHF
jgi:hypothetical protein